MRFLLFKLKHIIKAGVERYGCLGLIANIVTLICGVYPLFTSIFCKDIGYTGYSICIMLLLICLLINHIHYVNHSVKLDDLYYNNVPLISTMTYLIKTRNASFYHDNELKVNSILVQISLNDCHVNPNNSVFVKEQVICYILNTTNETNHSVHQYELSQIHSLYTSSSQLNFSVSCNLLPSKRIINSDIQTTRLSSLINKVNIRFCGEGVQSQASAEIKIKRTSKDVTFMNCEYFLIDPEQYSPNSKKLYISFQSNFEQFQDRFYTLIEIDRITFRKRTYYNRLHMDAFNHELKNGITTHISKVYLVRVEAK